MNIQNFKIAILGLGYVGLPLAIEFGKKYKTIGFDINKTRISQLIKGNDITLETTKDEILASNFLKFSYEIEDLVKSNVYIVTVPTPINKFKTPDLLPLLNATKMLGKIIKKGDIIIYESTVYPGCTEEDCVPVLELESGLKFNKDFFCGYSPERINPGDKVNTLTKIKKVTSGSNLKTAILVDSLYNSIITAGTYKAPSIKVAEASKAIENAQRDLNISFVNELSLIFDNMNIDTNDVLDAAGSKWNFLKFKPGLVGGHCISVDPYYLAHKAESYGYYPQVILSGRRVNDNMGYFIANKVIKLMIQKNLNITNAKVLILGITFKENCTDIRNSKVVDIYNELKDFGLLVEVYDPNANSKEVEHEYGITLTDKLNKYSAIILAVSHKEFLTLNLTKLKISSKSVIYDIKSVLDRKLVDGRL